MNIQYKVFRAVAKQVFFIQDCIEGCRQHIADGTVDFVFADPPFNIKFGKNRSVYAYGVSNDENIYYNDNMTKEEYVEWCDQWIAEAWRILRENGILVIMSSWNHASAIETKANEIGFSTINHLIWRYEFGVFAKYRLTDSHYTFFILLKGDPSKRLWTFVMPEKQKKGVEDVEREMKMFLDEIDPEERERNASILAKKIEEIIYSKHGRYAVDDFFDDLRRLSKRYRGIKHPCKLSEDVLARIFGYFTRPGDTIVDLFVGSGTSMVAAILLGINYTGFEINPDYKSQIIKLVKTRLTSIRKKKKMQEL